MELGPFHFKLIENAGEVARKAHSMIANYLGLGLLVGPEIWFWVFGFQLLAPSIVWFLAAAAIFYGIVFRLKDQGIEKKEGAA